MVLSMRHNDSKSLSLTITNATTTSSKASRPAISPALFIPELLLEIFERCDLATLLRSTRVCRTWTPLANYFVYRDIHIPWRPPEGPILLQSLVARPEMLEVVRSFSFNGGQQVNRATAALVQFAGKIKKPWKRRGELSQTERGEKETELKLAWDYRHFSDAAVFPLLSHFVNLRSLKIHEFREFSPTDMTSSTPPPPVTLPPHITSLDLSRVPGRLAYQLLEGAPQCVSLSYESCWMRGPTIERQASSDTLHLPHLEHIRYRGNALSERTFVEGLFRSVTSSLKSLKIYENNDVNEITTFQHLTTTFPALVSLSVACLVFPGHQAISFDFAPNLETFETSSVYLHIFLPSLPLTVKTLRVWTRWGDAFNQDSRWLRTILSKVAHLSALEEVYVFISPRASDTTKDLLECKKEAMKQGVALKVCIREAKGSWFT